MNNFFSELKRRNVVRVAIAYVVVAWVILQFVDIIQDIVAFPGWFPQMVLVLLIIGLPIALLLSWAYEVTPEGVKKTEEVDKSKSVNLCSIENEVKMWKNINICGVWKPFCYVAASLNACSKYNILSVYI